MLKRKTILSLEQALALPYATQRFVQLGWRVIRIEAPAEGNENAGDPNRYIGADLGYHDLHSYYIAPNIGKEAITINLRKKEGQELLKKIIRELKVDVFMCNTLPKRYEQLGINFKNLSEANPDLIWCGISALGPDYPDRAGYDPALQALLGYTYLTGEPDGKPVPCGIPILDLKAGEEAFTQVLLAMLQQKEKVVDEKDTKSPTSEGVRGTEIHISMAQCAASWLITALPQLNFVKSDDELFKRSGNEHRSFIPCNAYPTKDGFVYLAIGNDSQWAKLVSHKGFEKLFSEKRKTNEGRMAEKEKIYKEIGALTKNYTTKEFTEICLSLDLSAAPINSIKDVAELEFVKKYFLKTNLPVENLSVGKGREVKLFPAAHNTEFLQQNNFSLKCSPRLGEHNDAVYKSCGITEEEMVILKEKKII